MTLFLAEFGFDHCSLDLRKIFKVKLVKAQDLIKTDLDSALLKVTFPVPYGLFSYEKLVIPGDHIIFQVTALKNVV